MSELSKVDSQIHQLIDKEYLRQKDGLELIASENYVSQAVREAQGSILTNKYAEGLPGKRYYGGCEIVDMIENLAIERVCSLFQSKFANVQAHSGSGANMAVYLSSLTVGDTILGMSLNHGGHLTHGGKMNFSGKLFEGLSYGLHPETECLDYDNIRDLAKKHRPKMIVAGASAYPRQIDFKIFSEIAKEIEAILFVDMAHIAGLVAVKLHPDPIPYADYVTSTTHKTLRGPRGGIILTQDEEKAKKVNSMVFPGIQGGPLEHVIAAKAVCFKEALDHSFKDYQLQVLKNAKVLGETLMAHGFELVTRGTDNHLLLVKVQKSGLNGKQAEKLLEEVNITCNKNMIPNDPLSPFITSGIRIGTPAITSRGMKEAESKKIGEFIAQILLNPSDQSLKDKIKNQVHEICQNHAMP